MVEVKYFEDFDCTPQDMNSKSGVLTGQTVTFKYGGEYRTAYVYDICGSILKTFSKERQNFRNYAISGVSDLKQVPHFLTHKPKSKSKNFEMIKGLSADENLAIAKMREPGTDWEIVGGVVVKKVVNPQTYLKQSQTKGFDIKGDTLIIYRDGSISFKGRVYENDDVINAFKRIVEILSEE